MKSNDPLMDQVKAYVTLTIELNYKVGSNVAPGGNYPLQDLNSAACATRFNSKEIIFACIPQGAMLVLTGHHPR